MECLMSISPCGLAVSVLARLGREFWSPGLAKKRQEYVVEVTELSLKER